MKKKKKKVRYVYDYVVQLADTANRYRGELET